MLLHNYRKLNIQRHQYARRADVVFADSVVGEKNLFVCARLCGSVANFIFPQRSPDLAKKYFSVLSAVNFYLKNALIEEQT